MQVFFNTCGFLRFYPIGTKVEILLSATVRPLAHFKLSLSLDELPAFRMKPLSYLYAHIFALRGQKHHAPPQFIVTWMLKGSWFRLKNTRSILWMQMERSWRPHQLLCAPSQVNRKLVSTPKCWSSCLYMLHSTGLQYRHSVTLNVGLEAGL